MVFTDVGPHDSSVSFPHTKTLSALSSAFLILRPEASAMSIFFLLFFTFNMLACLTLLPHLRCFKSYGSGVLLVNNWFWLLFLLFSLTIDNVLPLNMCFSTQLSHNNPNQEPWQSRQVHRSSIFTVMMIREITIIFLIHPCSCLFKSVIMEIDYGDQLLNFFLDRRRKLANKLMKWVSNLSINNNMCILSTVTGRYRSEDFSQK